MKLHGAKHFSYPSNLFRFSNRGLFLECVSKLLGDTLLLEGNIPFDIAQRRLDRHMLNFTRRLLHSSLHVSQCNGVLWRRISFLVEHKKIRTLDQKNLFFVVLAAAAYETCAANAKAFGSIYGSISFKIRSIRSTKGVNVRTTVTVGSKMEWGKS